MQTNEKDYEIQKLNLLAFPRNQLPKCALTGVTATVQLITPHITLVNNFIYLLFDLLSSHLFISLFISLSLSIYLFLYLVLWF